MKTIYIARHGETDANKTMKFQGYTDNHLNDKGIEQAEELADRVQCLSLDKIYASDLTRAIQTATPMAERRNLSVISVPDLKEICFGKWEGLTFQEIKERWPDSIDTFFKTPESAHIEGGETFQAVQKRAWEALEKIVTEQKEDTSVMIVAHGGTVRVLLCAVLGLNLNDMWKLYVDNVGLSCVVKWDERYLLKFHNYVGKI